MIIELTGLPGSGKTTLITEIEKIARERNERLLFAKDEILENFRLGIFKHNRFMAGIVSGTILLFVFFLDYRKYKHIFNLASSYVKTSKQSLLCRLNILRNVIKKLSTYHYCHNHFQGKNVLIDEGLCHIAFNIFVDSTARVLPDEEIELFLDLIPWPNKLIVVSASKSSIEKRLHQRGHWRIDFENQQKYENFINDCYRVFRLIKQHSRHKTITIEVNTKEQDSIENIAYKIIDGLREIAIPQSVLS